MKTKNKQQIIIMKYIYIYETTIFEIEFTNTDILTNKQKTKTKNKLVNLFNLCVSMMRLNT